MPAKNSNQIEMIVSAADISIILGLSQSRIRQLVKEDALVRVEHGKYDVPASIAAYIDYKINNVLNEDELDKGKEEALWTRARRKKTELEYKIMEGELHRGADVKRLMGDQLAAFKARLLSIPSKTAPMIVGKTEILPIQDTLKKAVYEALDELSEYDPYAFFDTSKDKIYLGDDEDEDEELDIYADDEEERIEPHGRKAKTDE
ncbi:type IV toxin-antitoxin system AbiEi family antitoxin domain-containing protein [Jeotgalibacillus terrae]|uniref:Phage DNA packaging protein, Nu1 subunit of terminase n=1 Tax=Jeotgalibacillus terrae TaxID=587735 RepID=A0ABW5ZFN8_9BACL|nr:type IV toxin-antitoxin system AbiEi family antitoxin domain-containing protein [Jeotgalibacillus terrae]MBM7580021.1 hypothetical protein [Jeotgalibacillus terrae]